MVGNRCHLVRTVAVGVFLIGTAFVAAATETTVPFPGIREHTPAVHALTNARIVTAPGTVIANGTVIVRDGVIQAVGANVAIPADARVWDMTGRTIYPGLIDAFSELPEEKASGGRENGRRDGGSSGTPSSGGGANYWNPHVVPQTRADRLYAPSAKTNEAYRSQGITTRLVAPAGGIIKGTSAVVGTGDDDPAQAILRGDVALHLRLAPVGDWENRGYPDSPMGAMSLVRQAFYDADWYRQAHAASAKQRDLPRPERNDALEALHGYAGGSRAVMIEAEDEKDFLRADQIGREFGLNVIVRGSGDEYRRLDLIAATGRPVVVPLNFPEAPKVKTPEEAMGVTLETLMDWDIAPENPGRLAAAGMTIALTTDGLKETGKFLEAVRQAVARGLDADAALRALTTTPAALFGVSEKIGTIAPGKVANFVVTDGDLFAKKTEILETWINGTCYEVKTEPVIDARGTWELTLSEQQAAGDTVRLILKGEPAKLSGKITKDTLEEKLREVGLIDARIACSFKGDSLGWPGVVQLSATQSGERLVGDGVWSDGSRFTWTAQRTEAFVPEADTSKPDAPKMASFPVNYPLGAFGVDDPPEQPDAVLFRNATVWTSGPQGKLESGSVLIEKGKITAVGTDITAPAGARVVDLNGKHLAPGIIDAHSHTATDGGINESGQTISAEVRIGDYVDCNEINIYRELAGGVTLINVLHGSANTIGGQNQVLKTRWGAGPEEMKFPAATPGIKFALGENVKQSNWGDEFQTRYPQSRMGVEQIVRDEFAAAREYQTRWENWRKTKKGIPPRRDLELDAIVEVLDGTRVIHCHAYRQDEVLALLRTCEAFGVRLGVLQHNLEGYKVADEMVRHGAYGSAFSDWWAYKVEVYDAIPYNGALMHNAGVVVSFNSDSDELARRLNTEAAKAMKYGGIPEQEALKFVTVNSAIQLGVADRTGSIEVGKDADLSVWNGSPLSTLSFCEQTWIDGRRYFDRAEDAAWRERIQEMRAELIQKILTVGDDGGSGDSGGHKRKWPRADVFDAHWGDEFGEGR
ncbi:MAG TPA: amidohydrolase family protein [Acidobacteriota bacterium]|nr:amidohydrolase family protein [Acidobacteriota bacterium]